MSLADKEGDAWVSALAEPGTGSSRLLIAASSGVLHTLDLITNKLAQQCMKPQEMLGSLGVSGDPGQCDSLSLLLWRFEDLYALRPLQHRTPAASTDGLVLLRGPIGHRGAVAAATGGGRLLLLDSRTTWQSSLSTLAHAGGVNSLAVHGEMIASCGFSRRMGQVVPDNMVKVFDCRHLVHPLFTVPSAAPPAFLAWHTSSSMSLLCGSASGLVMFADPANPAAAETYQVDTGGDSLRCCSISASGDAVAFGGSGGYVHLWSSSPHPRISSHTRPLQRLSHPGHQESPGKGQGRH
eukprot:gene3367-3642_t